MAIDTSLVSEAAEVGLDATAPSAGGKRRFLFLRNRKALAGLAILAFFTLIAIIGLVAWAILRRSTVAEPGAFSS